MKISLKIADIEVTIEVPDGKDRSEMMSEALGCIDVLVQSRILLEGGIAAQAERAEDEQGQKPAGIEHQVIPAITMSGLYA